MARRTRTRRLLGAVGVTALATAAALASPPRRTAQAAAGHGRRPSRSRPDPSYQQDEFEGWGTSLVWFANATGDYPDEVREKLADCSSATTGSTSTSPATTSAAATPPTCKDYLRAGGAVEGWWKAPAGTTREDTDWWSADDPDALEPGRRRRPSAGGSTGSRTTSPTGRRSATPRRGSMTVSGYVSGGFDANDRPAAGRDRSTTSPPTWCGATEHLEKAHGIKFDTLDPFNEPNTNYWGTKLGADGQPVGGRQEGAHIGPELQQKVIQALAAALEQAPTPTPRSPRWTRPTRASSPRTGTPTRRTSATSSTS